METKTEQQDLEREATNIPVVQKKPFELADGQRFGKETSEGQTKLIDHADGLIDRGIKTHEEYEIVGHFGKTLKGRIKAVENRMEDILSPLRQAKKSADELKRMLVNPLKTACNKLSSIHTEYELDVERKRKAEKEAAIAEQKRRDEEARKEQERIDEENRKAQEKYEAEQAEHEAKKKRLADEQKQKEEDARIEQAAAAEAEGDKGRADDIIDTPTAEPAPAPTPPAPKKPVMKENVPPPSATLPLPEPKTQELPDTGSTTTRRWKGRITDPYKVLQAIIEDKDKPEGEKRIDLKALKFNDAWFNDRARTLKGLMKNLIPGAEAMQEAKGSF